MGWFRSLVFASCCVVSCAASAQTRAQNIPYTTDSAGAQRGDLYEPAGAGPFPAIVYLHGGSWRSGSKGDFSRLAGDLARDGYVGFSIDYDLKAHSFPLAWEEGRAAVSFLRAHAAEYRIDPARIVVVGTSAGGELAALMALAPEGPPSVKGEAVPVSAAVILNGVFELCASAHVIERYLGGSCAANRAVYEDASPLDHVHAGAVPFFVGHGTKDGVVPYGAAQVFLSALQKAGDSVTAYSAEGGGHMYWEKKEFYAENLRRVESFLAGLVKCCGLVEVGKG